MAVSSEQIRIAKYFPNLRLPHLLPFFAPFILIFRHTPNGDAMNPLAPDQLGMCGIQMIKKQCTYLLILSVNLIYLHFSDVKTL